MYPLVKQLLAAVLLAIMCFPSVLPKSWTVCIPASQGMPFGSPRQIQTNVMSDMGGSGYMQHRHRGRYYFKRAIPSLSRARCRILLKTSARSGSNHIIPATKLRGCRMRRPATGFHM